MGVIECAKHDLMEPYPVYYEKEGEHVAEFKFTVLIMPNNTMKITGIPLDLESYQSENSITDPVIKVDNMKKQKNWVGTHLIVSFPTRFQLFFAEPSGAFAYAKEEKEEEAIDKEGRGDQGRKRGREWRWRRGRGSQKINRLMAS